MEYDLIVIGGGSGGLGCARKAASLNKKVLLIEKSKLGGTCVNRGCIPKKIYKFLSTYCSIKEEGKFYGLENISFNLNFEKFRKNLSIYISRLNEIFAKNIEREKIEFLSGEARIVDNTVCVNDTVYKGKYIVVATGNQPNKLKIEGEQYLKMSDDLFLAEKIPKSLVIIGGGYIGVEMACIYAHLGSSVTILIRGEQILQNFEKEIVDLLEENFQGKIKIEKQCALKKINSHSVETVNGKIFNADFILNATGRRVYNFPDLPNNGREIITDDTFHVRNNIYAVGDVIGQNLTPVALRSGRELADFLFANKTIARSKIQSIIPTVIFSSPPIASVGITNSDKYTKLVSNSISLKTAIFPIREKNRAVVYVDEKKIIKGIHLIGTGADEVIQGFTIAIDRLTIDELREIIPVHPTLGEEILFVQ